MTCKPYVHDTTKQHIYVWFGQEYSESEYPKIIDVDSMELFRTETKVYHIAYQSQHQHYTYLKQCKENFLKAFSCMDCGTYEAMWGTSNDLWLQAVPDYFKLKQQRILQNLATMLCRGCFNKRL